jgi:hypothetical protein
MKQGRVTSGERSCGRIVADPGQLCGRSAVGHFLWTHDGENGVACDQHTATAMADAEDWHPITDDCTMPGVVWRYSTAEGAGRCEWPSELSADAEVESDALVTP